MLLSGLGNDGVLGLVAITAAGGLSLVRTPEEAALGVDDIADALSALAEGRALEVAAPDRLSR